MLSLALPSGKSLEAHTLALFKDASIPLVYEPPKHRAKIDCPGISKAVFMKPFDIPKLVSRGSYDLGICGEDALTESWYDYVPGADLDSIVKLAELNYSRSTRGKTEVVLFTQVSNETRGSWMMQTGLKIATEYPNITRSFFAQDKKLVNLETFAGSAEAHVAEGDFPYGVCITETGRSLKENGLEVLRVLLESSTVLIANRKATQDPKNLELMHTLELLLVGAMDAREKVLLKMNVLVEKEAAVLAELPALQAPTVSKLSDMQYVSVETVAFRSELSTLAPKLLKLGAKGLIEIPISRVIQKW